jgi:hypothetical protein
VLDQS